MIVTKLYYLWQLLRKNGIGKFSKLQTNFIELLSDDPDVVNKLKALRFMQGFHIKVYFEFKDTTSKIIHIFQERTSCEELSIEKSVEFEYNKIFEQYSDKIDFMYFIDNHTFILESDDLNLIHEIYLNLKNFEYANIQNKHIFSYLKQI